ncbi:MAG: hypothetical protein IKQ91_04285 [Oscillospiraceae bacterium]|nr:hypothetical protein [Oscillospiraceae bacterium]
MLKKAMGEVEKDAGEAAWEQKWRPALPAIPYHAEKSNGRSRKRCGRSCMGAKMEAGTAGYIISCRKKQWEKQKKDAGENDKNGCFAAEEISLIFHL